jgi:DNA-binding transcriptional ArsR family regulator
MQRRFAGAGPGAIRRLDVEETLAGLAFGPHLVIDTYVIMQVMDSSDESRPVLEVARAPIEDAWPLDPELLRMHAEYCKAVANEHRLAILYLVSEGERSVGDLAATLNLSINNVSQHLRVMKTHGLLSSRRDGRTVYYTTSNPKLVAACHLIREALIEQHQANQVIIQRSEDARALESDERGGPVAVQPVDSP